MFSDAEVGIAYSKVSSGAEKFQGQATSHIGVPHLAEDYVVACTGEMPTGFKFS